MEDIIDKELRLLKCGDLQVVMDSLRQKPLDFESLYTARLEHLKLMKKCYIGLKTTPLPNGILRAWVAERILYCKLTQPTSTPSTAITAITSKAFITFESTYDPSLVYKMTSDELQHIIDLL